MNAAVFFYIDNSFFVIVFCSMSPDTVHRTGARGCDVPSRLPREQIRVSQQSKEGPTTRGCSASHAVLAEIEIIL